MFPATKIFLNFFNQTRISQNILQTKPDIRNKSSMWDALGSFSFALYVSFNTLWMAHLLRYNMSLNRITTVIMCHVLVLQITNKGVVTVKFRLPSIDSQSKKCHLRLSKHKSID